MDSDPDISPKKARIEIEKTESDRDSDITDNASEDGRNEGSDSESSHRVPLCTQDTLDNYMTSALSGWSRKTCDLLQMDEVTVLPTCDPEKFLESPADSQSVALLKFVSLSDECKLWRDIYIDGICKAMCFTVPDKPIGTKLYDGYPTPNQHIKQAVRKELQNICDQLSESRANIDALALEWMKMAALAPQYAQLARRTTFASEFITKVLSFLVVHNDGWKECACEELFLSFAAMSGLQIRQASSEKKQEFEIFQKKCSGNPDFRVYVPEHGSASWWCPENFAGAKGEEPPGNWRVAAIVQVKSDVAADVIDPIRMVQPVLGQVVGELLGELMSGASVVDSCGQQLLGIVVQSTRVQFVMMNLTADAKELYNTPLEDCFEDEKREKAHVSVSDVYDFLKGSDRENLLKLLFRISEIKSRP